MVFDCNGVPSNSEKEFLLEALASGHRLDGRGRYEFRKLVIGPNSNIPGQVTVQLGRTRVLVKVSCQVVRPHPNRGSEGLLSIAAELFSIASLQFEVGRSSEEEVIISRMLEKTLRRSRALDLEGLCIVAGEKVWQIRVDLHYLDHGGNLVDAGCLAALAGLAHFRRPDVSVHGEEVIIHQADEKELVPLTLHHLPVAMTFAFFQQGDFMVVDPSAEEEKINDGQITIAMNLHQEICAFSKPGGTPLPPDQLLQCTQLAVSLSKSLISQFKDALGISN